VRISSLNHYDVIVIHGLIGEFARWLREEADPDVLACFDTRHSIGVLAARARALGLGALRLARRDDGNGSGGGGGGVALESVVQYDAEHVRRAGRMAATSNMETFRVTGVDGRWVVDRGVRGRGLAGRYPQRWRRHPPLTHARCRRLPTRCRPLGMTPL
jgi:hypothetical protein